MFGKKYILEANWVMTYYVNWVMVGMFDYAVWRDLASLGLIELTNMEWVYSQCLIEIHHMQCPFTNLDQVAIHIYYKVWN